MRVLRFSKLALAAASVLLTAWSLSAGGCGPHPGTAFVPNCFQPSAAETGADGGYDPCHCNVPPPFSDNSCPCTSGDIYGEGLTGIEVYHECMSLLPPDAGDGAEGGPLAPCDGQCWPLAPVPSWTGPLLLSVVADGTPVACPDASSAPVWGGYGKGTFALACSSNASGTCSDPRDVCGPESAAGFLTCVLQVGDVACPLVGPYTAERLVFYESSGQPLLPFTFCCIPPQQQQ